MFLHIKVRFNFLAQPFPTCFAYKSIFLAQPFSTCFADKRLFYSSPVLCATFRLTTFFTAGATGAGATTGSGTGSGFFATGI